MTHGLSPRILDTLRQLGLTEYAARCYVALLSLRSAEAAAIAEAAEVPRTKVYGVLKDLADAGWVVASGGRPVVYQPVPPEERIHAAEKRIAEDAATAARELQARFQLGTQMVPATLYVLRGEAAIGTKSEELVARAHEELFVNLGFAFDEDASRLAPALRKARRRGVTLKMLFGRAVDAAAWGDLAVGARAASFPFRCIVSDGRQALVAFPPEAGAPPVALWNPTQAFLEAIGPMLRAAWEAAPPIEP